MQTYTNMNQISKLTFGINFWSTKKLQHSIVIIPN